MDIKVGDTVERVAGKHGGMIIGDTATVSQVDSIDSLQLKDFRGVHAASNFKVIARQGETTCPTKKTVADVWETHGGAWPDGDYDFMYYHPYSTKFYGASNTYEAADEDGCREDSGQKVMNGNEAWQLVCTREQFEAYGKEQEQEGEKWTHEFCKKKCRIVCSDPDEYGRICILRENAGYVVVSPSDLKSIRPKLTKAQAWDMLAEYSDINDVGMILTQYDITD